MDVGLRTPLLDFFRRGDVARDVRLLAAQGAIAPRALEQLGILALLTRDVDLEIRQTAEATLHQLPPGVVASFIARADVPTDLREFFVSRGIVPGDASAAQAERPIVDADDTEYGPDAATDEQKAATVTKLSALSVPERVKAAMKGTREMRTILVRDANRMVALAVLSSPKLTETEVEAISRMGSVSEDVLRTIGQTRAWTKSYQVASALVRNAKTPLAVSMNLLQRLHERDVRGVSIDRNVPEALRIAARKRVVSSQGR
ncbi:MAG: hypothetical protein ABR606_01735 [Vicinamibacterales bacterium]